MQHVRLHELLGLKGARFILKNCALNALLMEQNLEEQVIN